MRRKYRNCRFHVHTGTEAHSACSGTGGIYL